MAPIDFMFGVGLDHSGLAVGNAVWDIVWITWTALQLCKLVYCMSICILVIPGWPGRCPFVADKPIRWLR